MNIAQFASKESNERRRVFVTKELDMLSELMVEVESNEKLAPYLYPLLERSTKEYRKELEEELTTLPDYSPINEI